MKSLSAIIALMLLLAISSFAAGKKGNVDSEIRFKETIKVETKTPFVANAIIYTPTSKIYDDAVDRVQYEGYTLYDTNHNAVLEVDASIDKPVKLNLQAGDYTVKLDGQKNPVYSISVVENQFNKFVIE